MNSEGNDGLGSGLTHRKTTCCGELHMESSLQYSDSDGATSGLLYDDTNDREDDILSKREALRNLNLRISETKRRVKALKDISARTQLPNINGFKLKNVLEKYAEQIRSVERLETDLRTAYQTYTQSKTKTWYLSVTSAMTSFASTFVSPTSSTGGKILAKSSTGIDCVCDYKLSSIEHDLRNTVTNVLERANICSNECLVLKCEFNDLLNGRETTNRRPNESVSKPVNRVDRQSDPPILGEPLIKKVVPCVTELFSMAMHLYEKKSNTYEKKFGHSVTPKTYFENIDVEACIFGFCRILSESNKNSTKAVDGAVDMMCKQIAGLVVELDEEFNHLGQIYRSVCFTTAGSNNKDPVFSGRVKVNGV